MKLYDLKTFERIDTKTDEGKAWVRERQEELGGLKVDGDFGPRTRRAYKKVYGEIIRRKENLPKLSTPRIKKIWGYHHSHGWPIKDDAWETLTEDDTHDNGLLRLVSGRRSAGIYSRSPRSLVSLDSMSLGIAHWWSARIPKLMSRLFVEKDRGFLVEHVGETMADILLSPRDARKLIGNKRGKTPFKPKHLPFLRAWNYLGSFATTMERQSEYWLESVVPKALRIIKTSTPWEVENDWNGGRLVAGVARMVNSSPSRARRCLMVGLELGEYPLDCLRQALSTPKSKGGYGHPERYTHIIEEPRFDGHYPQ